MVAIKLTQKVLLAFACCLSLVLVPMSLSAQGIIKKGAEGVQKGVQKGVEGAKEGAETVGRETKKAVTGEDTDVDRQKSTEPQSTTPATESQSTSRQSTTGHTTGK